MTLSLFGHPFSSYTQKALIALYENATPFHFRLLSPYDTDTLAEFGRLWPIRRFPLLLDGDRPVAEATVIIEHLAIHHPGPVSLLPADTAEALQVRFLDRFFDNYLQGPMQKIVFDRLRAEDVRDPTGVAEARGLLDTAYDWLERHMTGRDWAAGTFSLADCAAAPALFYADWVHPIGVDRPAVTVYRERLKARASFARAIDEARPYRAFFPGGAPERD